MEQATGMAKQEYQSLFETFTQEFYKELIRQTETEIKIENKLHCLLDKRTSVKEPSDIKDVVSPSDIASKFREGIGTLQNNNMMLERILNHLSEII